MRWPAQPVEHRRSFRPPHCPWRSCPRHSVDTPGSYSYRSMGTYTTCRGRVIPRFVCTTCRRSFSRQSFATSYYLKRPELLKPIAAGLLAGSAHRQIARSLGCAPSTVTRLSARLGRHCLLLLTRALSHLSGRLEEPLVIDHFETFEYTQDYPFGVATAVGSSSWFLYHLDPAPHGRTGKVTPAQQSRLSQRPRRAVRGGYEGSTRRLLDATLPLAPSERPLEVIGDGHPAYMRSVAGHPQSDRIRLASFPNPQRGPKGSRRTPQARARDRAMFPNDSLHGLLRHSLAHHRRETIAFGRRLNALMERFFVAAIWRNFVKGRSERKPDPATPAMAVGLTDRPWSWRRVLSQRVFPNHESPPPAWGELYRRLWETPLLRSNQRHEKLRAF